MAAELPAKGLVCAESREVRKRSKKLRGMREVSVAYTVAGVKRGSAAGRCGRARLRGEELRSEGSAQGQTATVPVAFAPVRWCAFVYRIR
jgi:hypothetical protein